MPHSIAIATNGGFKNGTCHAAIGEGKVPGRKEVEHLQERARRKSGTAVEPRGTTETFTGW